MPNLVQILSIFLKLQAGKQISGPAFLPLLYVHCKGKVHDEFLVASNTTSGAQLPFVWFVLALS